MKRAAIILIPILILLSIAVTVYVVATQSLRLENQASETEIQTVFSKSAIKDWCDSGPFVEINSTGADYDTKEGTQRLKLKAKRSAEINDEDLEFSLLEIGCSKNTSVLGECSSSCEAEDPGYYNQVTKYTIPKGENEIDITLTLAKKPTQANCGCAQQNLHIMNVGKGDIASCNTVFPKDGHPNHEYLYSLSLGKKCLVSENNEIKKEEILVEKTETLSITPSPVVLSDNSLTQDKKTSSNRLPICIGLSAAPTSGTAPLTVHFIGSGTDLDGAVTRFDFDYGDNKKQSIEKEVGEMGSVEIDHTYTKSGRYVASLRVQDNENDLSEVSPVCGLDIVVSGGTLRQIVDNSFGAPVLGTSTTGTPTPTASASATPTATRTPTATKTPTPTKTAVGGATSSATATIAAPDVPVAGGIMPTVLIGFMGLLIVSLGLLFAL